MSVMQIVDDEVNEIVSSAIHYKLIRLTSGQPYAQLLSTANIDAFNYRYKTNDSYIIDFKFTELPDRYRLLELISSLIYQCSQGPNWNRSLGDLFLKSIIYHLQ